VTRHVVTNQVEDGEHVFYSRIKRQGVVAKINRANKHITYITVLPKGASRVAKEGTGKHMIESVNVDIMYID
jgi:hypothetical protein